MISKLLRKPGPRPPFYEVTNAVFGPSRNVDTDGDSYDRDSVTWTELWAVSRDDPTQELDIAPVQDNPLVLRISASTDAILQAATSFLVLTAGGELTDN